jgi:hypothetical protein
LRIKDKGNHFPYILEKNNVIGEQYKIYLINMNMNVIFTGAKTEEELCFNSLLDGELILHNKKGQFINTFAAFDIYYSQNVDVRARPFVRTITKDPKYFTEETRLSLLKIYVKNNIYVESERKKEKK